jgi:hypothetical protein
MARAIAIAIGQTAIIRLPQLGAFNAKLPYIAKYGLRIANKTNLQGELRARQLRRVEFSTRVVEPVGFAAKRWPSQIFGASDWIAERRCSRPGDQHSRLEIEMSDARRAAPPQKRSVGFDRNR